MKIQQIEGECEVSLRSSSRQPSGIYVKCDRLQPRIEPIPKDLQRAVPLDHAADIGRGSITRP